MHYSHINCTIGRTNRRGKATKYEELVNNCKEHGWKTWCFLCKIGRRGFVEGSANRAMSIIGLTGKEKMKMLRDASDQSERASNWLWMKQEYPNYLITVL